MAAITGIRDGCSPEIADACVSGDPAIALPARETQIMRP
jgi:hypothetical protein